jgi:hypothetical protein
MVCGRPGLVHDFGSATTTFDSRAVDGIGTPVGANNNGSSVAASPPAGSDAEITFISGVTSTNQVAGTSFWTWNGNRPATYCRQVGFVGEWSLPSLLSIFAAEVT